jgi:hypothetical protein
MGAKLWGICWGCAYVITRLLHPIKTNSYEKRFPGASPCGERFQQQTEEENTKKKN